MKTWDQFRFAAVLLLAFLLAAGCGKEAPPPAAPPAAPVSVSQPEQRDIVEWDEYSGRVDAVDSVEVRPRVSGYLQSVNFKDGAEVQKGDLLFVIDQRPYQADLDRAEAEAQQAQTRVDLASNDLARADRLLQARAISAEEADTRAKAVREAAAALHAAEAATETARLNMDYTRITAPISGRIGRRLVTPGNLVHGDQMGEATLLTTIVSLDPIYCYFDADEHSILKYRQLAHQASDANLREGRVPCEIELAGETGFPHAGTVDFVDNRIDPSTGSVWIRGVFSNADRILQPGYFAHARVPASERHAALLIPDLAIGADQSQKFVYVVNSQNIAEYRTVKLGPIVDGLRVVREGLQPGDWVVVNGLMGVRPGATVAPTRAASTATAAATP